MTPHEAAEAMRDRAAGVVEFKRYPFWEVLSGLIRRLPLPGAQPDKPARDEPARIDLTESGVTQWVFEDCPHVAKDAFPGVFHFIDELRAMDDGRLVGVQFWGPKPPQPGKRESDAATALCNYDNEPVNECKVARCRRLGYCPYAGGQP